MVQRGNGSIVHSHAKANMMAASVTERTEEVDESVVVALDLVVPVAPGFKVVSVSVRVAGLADCVSREAGEGVPLYTDLMIMQPVRQDRMLGPSTVESLSQHLRLKQSSESSLHVQRTRWDRPSCR